MTSYLIIVLESLKFSPSYSGLTNHSKVKLNVSTNTGYEQETYPKLIKSSKINFFGQKVFAPVQTTQLEFTVNAIKIHSQQQIYKKNQEIQEPSDQDGEEIVSFFCKKSELGSLQWPNNRKLADCADAKHGTPSSSSIVLQKDSFVLSIRLEITQQSGQFTDDVQSSAHTDHSLSDLVFASKGLSSQGQGQCSKRISSPVFSNSLPNFISSFKTNQGQLKQNSSQKPRIPNLNILQIQTILQAEQCSPLNSSPSQSKIYSPRNFKSKKNLQASQLEKQIDRADKWQTRSDVSPQKPHMMEISFQEQENVNIGNNRVAQSRPERWNNSYYEEGDEEDRTFINEENSILKKQTLSTAQDVLDFSLQQETWTQPSEKYQQVYLNGNASKLEKNSRKEYQQRFILPIFSKIVKKKRQSIAKMERRSSTKTLLNRSKIRSLSKINIKENILGFVILAIGSIFAGVSSSMMTGNMVF